MMAKEKQIAGVLYGLIGMLGFSGTIAATRAAVISLSPMTITSGRIVIATVLALVTLFCMRKMQLPDRELVGPILLIESGLAVGFPLFVALALEAVPAVHGAVAIGLTPAATAIIAYFRLGDRPKPVFWVASAIAFTSVFYYALDAGGGDLFMADLWLLFAIISVAFAYVEGGRVSNKLGSTVTLCWSMLMLSPAAIVVLIWSIRDLDFATISLGSWFGMTYLGVVSMFLASVFWYRGLAIGGISRIAQINLLVPLLALVWSNYFLGEKITPTALGSSVVVLIAMIVCLNSRVQTK